MTIAIVQSPAGNSAIGGSSSLALTWTNPTTAGNYLYAAFYFNQANPDPITPPSGWSQNGTTVNVGNLFIALFQRINASSESGSKTWNYSNTPLEVCGGFIEFSGVATSSPQDGATQSANGSSTTPKGGIITTHQNNDVVVSAVGGVTSAGTFTFTSPLPSGTNITTNVVANDAPNTSDNRFVLLTHITTTPVTNEQAQVTSSRSVTWLGVTIALQSADSTTTTTTTTSTTTSTTTTTTAAPTTTTTTTTAAPTTTTTTAAPTTTTTTTTTTTAAPTTTTTTSTTTSTSTTTTATPTTTTAGPAPSFASQCCLSSINGVNQ